MEHFKCLVRCHGQKANFLTSRPQVANQFPIQKCFRWKLHEMNDAYSQPQQAEKKEINLKSSPHFPLPYPAQEHLISKSIAVSSQTEVLVRLQTGNYLQVLDGEQAHQGIFFTSIFLLLCFIVSFWLFQRSALRTYFVHWQVQHKELHVRYTTLSPFSSSWLSNKVYREKSFKEVFRSVQIELMSFEREKGRCHLRFHIKNTSISPFMYVQKGSH